MYIPLDSGSRSMRDGSLVCDWVVTKGRSSLSEATCTPPSRRVLPVTSNILHQLVVLQVTEMGVPLYR